nr:Pol polyprotein [Tanacetum cinerariifolium]
MPKRVAPRQANMVNDNLDVIVMVSDVIAMIFKVNLVGFNNSIWWVDTRATRHVCADKSMFHSFRSVDNGEKLYMGNFATVNIKREGDVILKMTSEKALKLTNVLYLSEISKNLVPGSKNKTYVGKGYVLNCMFKLNVKVIMNDINKMNSSAYLIESFNVWHARLGNQNGIAERKNRTLKEMVNSMLINSGLSQDILGEAILTATYLLNKVPRKKKEETPYELWMGRKPSYQYLRVLRCLAKVAIPTPKAQKIGPKYVGVFSLDMLRIAVPIV